AAAPVRIGHPIAADHQQGEHDLAGPGSDQAESVQGPYANGHRGEDEGVIECPDRDGIEPESANPRIKAERVKRRIAREKAVSALKPGRGREPVAEIQVDRGIREHHLVLPDDRAPGRGEQVGPQKGGEYRVSYEEFLAPKLLRTLHQFPPWIR